MKNVDVRITISCGLAEYPKDTDQANELIVKADEAMYKAKSRGGNLVSKYSDIGSRINGMETTT
ncbi:MAG TPA: diguanylate cyclase [Candidatus Marinimicrobia bacterium]|nr:diguanylate cyclase [Candidatus Neomarinimicrobiota bacterium]